MRRMETENRSRRCGCYVADKYDTNVVGEGGGSRVSEDDPELNKTVRSDEGWISVGGSLP